MHIDTMATYCIIIIYLFIKQILLLSTLYKAAFYTLLSTCNEVTFPANIYFPLRYFACKHVVTTLEMCAL